jgi:predicted anti-sigma-YlaC factor YlaD
MIGRRSDACVVHRPALLEFVEHRALGLDGPAALDHLARCERCERDLSEVAQTIIALRRLGERARQVEAPTDGWPSLRDRLERSQRAADEAARRLRRAFGSAIVGIAVAAVVAVSSLTGTVTTGLVDQPAVALGARPATSTIARRYDPFAQPLTEGIVLAIAGGPTRVAPAERVQNVPTSTDRIDDPPVFASVHITSQPIAPRTAYRT